MPYLLQANLPQADIKALKDYAAVNDKSVSELIREIIHDFLQNPNRVSELFTRRLQRSVALDRSNIKPFRATVDPVEEQQFKNLAEVCGLPFDRLLLLAIEDRTLH